MHYRELDKYPPILNLVNFAIKERFSISVISGLFFKKNKLIIFLDYLIFTLRTFFSLLFSKNQNVLYYESISAIPIYFYFRLLPYSKKKLFIHYHEYFSKEEYLKQSFFERLGRKLEIVLFKRARWISHTNKQRLELFHLEFPFIEKNVLKELPNYPPPSWQNASEPIEIDKKNAIKMVHIGALSIENMFLENLLNFCGNNTNFSIDFYSHNFNSEVIELLSKYTNCQIKGSISYEKIPTLKGKYDVGLVLYNGSTLNFTYNAPNKVFEYLALDFDVWCSDKLISAKDFQRLDCYPKLLMVDYTRLDKLDICKARSIEGLSYSASPYNCEGVYAPFFENLI